MRGGRREGAGRKPGARNKRTVEVLTAADNVLATIVEPFQGDGVALLQLVYKDPRQPLNIRMNAAAMAAKYERPTAVIMKEVPRDLAPEAVDARIRELMKRVLPGPTIEATLDEED
jgi:hypothetical protein